MDGNPFDISQVYRNISDIRTAQMRNRIADMQMEEFLKEKGVQEKVSALASRYIGGVGAPQLPPTTKNAYADTMAMGEPLRLMPQPPPPDWQGYTQALYKEGLPEQAMATEKMMSEQETAALGKKEKQLNILGAMEKMDEAQRKTISEATETTGRLAFGQLQQYNQLINAGQSPEQAAMSMQGDYENGLRQLATMYGAEKIYTTASPSFDPTKAQQAVDLSMSVKDWLAAMKPTEHKETKGTWEKVKDPNSQTGWSYQDVENPERMRLNAPPPQGMTGAGKPLPVRATDTLALLETTGNRLGALVTEFKPEYAGKTVTGGWNTMVKELSGLGADQVDWWKEWKALDAIQRHELFGATLTGNELKNWRAITVNERSSPEVIKSAVLKRIAVVGTKYNTLKKNYASQGYDLGEFGDLQLPPSAGFPGGQFPAMQQQGTLPPRPAFTGGEKIRKYNPATGRIE